MNTNNNEPQLIFETEKAAYNWANKVVNYAQEQANNRVLAQDLAQKLSTHDILDSIKETPTFHDNSDFAEFMNGKTPDNFKESLKIYNSFYSYHHSEYISTMPSMPKVPQKTLLTSERKYREAINSYNDSIAKWQKIIEKDCYEFIQKAGLPTEESREEFEKYRMVFSLFCSNLERISKINNPAKKLESFITCVDNPCWELLKDEHMFDLIVEGTDPEIPSLFQQLTAYPFQSPLHKALCLQKVFAFLPQEVEKLNDLYQTLKQFDDQNILEAFKTHIPKRVVLDNNIEIAFEDIVAINSSDDSDLVKYKDVNKTESVDIKKESPNSHLVEFFSFMHEQPILNTRSFITLNECNNIHVNLGNDLNSCSILNSTIKPYDNLDIVSTLKDYPQFIQLNGHIFINTDRLTICSGYNFYYDDGNRDTRNLLNKDQIKAFHKKLLESNSDFIAVNDVIYNKNKVHLIKSSNSLKCIFDRKATYGRDYRTINDKITRHDINQIFRDSITPIQEDYQAKLREAQISAESLKLVEKFRTDNSNLSVTEKDLFQLIEWTKSYLTKRVKQNSRQSHYAERHGQRNATSSTERNLRL